MEFTHTLKGNKEPNRDGHILVQGLLKWGLFLFPIYLFLSG